MLDWNGTIVDDLERSFHATRNALRAAGASTSIASLDQFQRSFGLPLARFFTDAGVADSRVAEAIAVWNSEMASKPTELAAGAGLLLTRARALGMTVHVISGAHEDTVQADAAALDVESLIDTVTGSAHPKRDAITALRRTSAPAIYVGDTEYDITEATAAGAYAVGTAYGYTPVSRLREAGAKVIVSDLSELTPTVEALVAESEAVGPRP